MCSVFMFQGIMCIHAVDFFLGSIGTQKPNKGSFEEIKNIALLISGLFILF